MSQKAFVKITWHFQIEEFYNTEFYNTDFFKLKILLFEKYQYQINIFTMIHFLLESVTLFPFGGILFIKLGWSFCLIVW